MPVKPNAATDELDSPYFKTNEKICQSFDQFIIAQNGETRGTYNAWSYNVLGKVRHPNKWEFRIKKSTFTSGNLLLSSKYQSLHVASTWTAQNLDSSCPSFKIRKPKFLDGFLISISKNLTWLDSSKNYVLKCTEPNNELISDLKTMLKPLFKDKLIWDLHYEKPVLSIELRSESTHTSLIEKLLAKNYA